MKKIFSLFLMFMLVLTFINSAYAFPFFRKKSSFPSKDFRSYLLFQNEWGSTLPKIFFGMHRDEVTTEIGEPSGDETYNSFSVDNYGKAGLLYTSISVSILELKGFSFMRFSPVIGNRVSEGYARQAGWAVVNTPSGKRFMEREIKDWMGNQVLIVYFIDEDREIFMEKDEAAYQGLLEK